MSLIFGIELTDRFSDYRRVNMVVIRFKMKTVRGAGRCIILHNKLAQHIGFFVLGTGKMQWSHLMTYSIRGDYSYLAGTKRNRLEIIDNQIVLFHRQRIDLFNKPSNGRAHKGPPEVNTTRFSKNKAQTVQTIFNRKWQFYIRLNAAHQHIYFAQSL